MRETGSKGGKEKGKGEKKEFIFSPFLPSKMHFPPFQWQHLTSANQQAIDQVTDGRWLHKRKEWRHILQCNRFGTFSNCLYCVLWVLMQSDDQQRGWTECMNAWIGFSLLFLFSPLEVFRMVFLCRSLTVFFFFIYFIVIFFRISESLCHLSHLQSVRLELFFPLPSTFVFPFPSFPSPFPNSFVPWCL